MMIALEAYLDPNSSIKYSSVLSLEPNRQRFIDMIDQNLFLSMLHFYLVQNSLKMETVADEPLYQMLLHSDVPNMLRLCGTNVRFRRACDNESLWKEKAMVDYGIREQERGKTWKDTYLERYRILSVLRSIPVRRWTEEVARTPGISLTRLMEKFERLLSSIAADPYHTIDGSTATAIVYLLLLHRRLVVRAELSAAAKVDHRIMDEVYAWYLRVLDSGFDVNKDEDDGKRIMPPFAFLVRAHQPQRDNAYAEYWKLAGPLFAHGLDVNKRGVFGGYKEHESYVDIAYGAVNPKTESRFREEYLTKPTVSNRNG